MSAILCGAAALFAASAFAEGLTVTDAMDRAVGFAQPPERIAIAGKASFMVADAVYLFPEARTRVVARSAGAFSRQGAGDFLARFASGQAVPVELAGNAGVEPVAAAKPDVVLLKSSNARLGGELERIGIPVVYLDFETPEQYRRDLAVLGCLLNVQGRARELISYFSRVSDSVRDATARLDPAKRPRTLLLQYSERGGVVAFSVPPAEWIQTRMVEEAGGLPVWTAAAEHGGWTIVNLEQIAAWDPDIVLVVNYAAPSIRAVADIMADTKWQALRAVREHKVFAFPGDFCSWDQPDTRWGLGLLWTGTRMHPQLFRNVDMPAEVVRFYSLYGMTETAVRTNMLPLIQENIGQVQDEK